jgi:hypothetical protein
MVRRLWITFLVVLAWTLIAEPFVERHPHFAVEKLYGFNALYGFLACAALILIAKGIGLFVKRPDTYYDDE